MSVQTLVLPSFTFESGETFFDVPVAYQTWGTLNEACDNAVVVCHALTGSTDAADWWAPLVGEGKVLDPERVFVVCANTLGSPYGTLAPATPGEGGRRLGLSRFPSATIRDTVRLHRALLDALGVRSVALAIGGSMGGMQVLEWGFEAGAGGAPFVKALCPIAVGARHSAWCIGWGEAERLAIEADARWRGGDYDPSAPPSAGLAAARAVAMLSYRSAASFGLRHDRAVMPEGHPSAGRYAAASYLRHQGARLVERFDAACYVAITRMMDTHDVARGRSAHPEGSDEALADALGQLRQPLLAVGIDSDVLYLPAEAQEIARLVPDGLYTEIRSPHGHDAFLIEFDQLAGLVRDWTNALRLLPA